MRLIGKLIDFFRMSEEDREIVSSVICPENIRRVLYLSLVAIPTSALYMIIFRLKAGNDSGITYQWRTAISISHMVIFISFTIISILIYSFSFRDSKNNLIGRICVNATIFILLIAGAVITAADQLVTSAITPFLSTSLVVGLIILVPPLYSFLYFTGTYIIFYYAISLTQVNHDILVSNQINGITAIAGGLCLSFILWRGYLIRVRQGRLIEKQNRELRTTLDLVNSQKNQIEAAHEQITASINYAKYIQSSVLPKAEEMESCVGEYFILHKAVEIVSGDFYWVSGIGNKAVIAAADCTGHGVPGAFMSMLGIAILNEIVNKESDFDPGHILGRLRKEVTDSLKQKGNRKEQKEGMNIALCVVDRENMKMQFAGAINPLYIIRDPVSGNDGNIGEITSGNAEFTEVRGDPMPIGIVDEMENFTSHEISICKGDTFYLFSDGFPDQFGGPNRKKFSYRQFRESLIKIRKATMQEQKLILEKILHDWMGNNSQTDDILVIGFRIKS
jgi:serine phosphatase RsbU (regulator of sigma subunit)